LPNLGGGQYPSNNIKPEATTPELFRDAQEPDEIFSLIFKAQTTFATFP
jgi:hypothetical protein